MPPLYLDGHRSAPKPQEIRPLYILNQTPSLMGKVLLKQFVSMTVAVMNTSSHNRQRKPSDTIIDKDLPGHDEFAAQRQVQQKSDRSGKNSTQTGRISTCSGSQDITFAPRTTSPRLRITAGIPIQSQSFLLSCLVRYSYSLGDPNNQTESCIRSWSLL